MISKDQQMKNENWKDIEFKDVDLSAIEMTGHMKTQIKKFFNHVEVNGMEEPVYSEEPNKWGGYTYMGHRIIPCKTLGDLSKVKYRHWWHGLQDIGFKTTRTVGLLINATAGETIITNKDMMIPREPEQRRAETLARHKKAYDMRQNGSSWKEISKALQITEKTAVTFITKHRKEANIQPDPIHRAQISENAMRKQYNELVENIVHLANNLKGKERHEVANILMNMASGQSRK
jgi:hypothetical protein